MVSWPKDLSSERTHRPQYGQAFGGTFLNSTSGMLNGGEAGVDVSRLLSSITMVGHSTESIQKQDGMFKSSGFHLGVILSLGDTG